MITIDKATTYTILPGLVPGGHRIPGSVDTATVATLGAFNAEGDLRKVTLGTGLSFSGGAASITISSCRIKAKKLK